MASSAMTRHAVVYGLVSGPRASRARHNSAHRSGWPTATLGGADESFDAVRDVIASTADRLLRGVAVANGRFDPSGHIAVRRQHIQGRESGVVDGARRLDELFGPRERFVILGQIAE